MVQIDSKPRATGYIAYKMLTPELKAQARRLRPRWQIEEFDRFEFFVTHAGNISKRYGHHQLTVEEFKSVTDMLERGQNPGPQKGGLDGWKPGHSFSFIHGTEP